MVYSYYNYYTVFIFIYINSIKFLYLFNIYLLHIFYFLSPVCVLHCSQRDELGLDVEWPWKTELWNEECCFLRDEPN